MEQWKDIPGYEGRYQASNTGFIKRLSYKYQSTYKGKPVDRLVEEKILGGVKLSAKGYARVNMGFKGTHQLHRLIALAWVPNPEGKEQVNHINGIKTDNRVENLEWVTNQENRDHAVKMNLQASRVNGKSGKLSTAQVNALKVLWTSGHYYQKHIAKLFDIEQQTVSKLISKG